LKRGHHCFFGIPAQGFSEKTLCLLAALFLSVFLCSPHRAAAETALSAGQGAAENAPSATAFRADGYQERVPHLVWRRVAEGLELSIHRAFALKDGHFQPVKGKDVFVIVRIDPEKFEFFLHMASEEGAAYSLADWAAKKGLRAAINASMYLPDKSTSTGHMQNLTHVNNQHIGGRLGAFFLAEPLRAGGDRGLPRADIIEREHPKWESLFNSYGIRVQNFRIITSEGEIPWKKGGPVRSIAAIAKEGTGKILFVFSEYPMQVVVFSEYLRLMPGVEVETAMYVEGSGDSGLFVLDEEGLPLVWSGRRGVLNTKGVKPVVVPNILGIRPR